jgi:hypothetical protein
MQGINLTSLKWKTEVSHTHTKVKSKWYDDLQMTFSGHL